MLARERVQWNTAAIFCSRYQYTWIDVLTLAQFCRGWGFELKVAKSYGDIQFGV